MNKKFENSLYLGSYRAVFSAIVAPAGVAPFFTISGPTSTGRQLTIKRLTVSGPTLTAVAYLNFLSTKYSTAHSAGTSTTATLVPLSSSMFASGTVVRGYTVAPTAGTSVGDIGAFRLLGQATTAAASGSTEWFDYTFNDESSPVLFNSNESIAIRFGTAPASAVTLSVTVEWDEYGV
jgi:hypothetical protein